MTEAESYGEFVKFPNLKEDSGSSREEVVKRAFKFANKCRDKEIDRFWTRGLYFWGFIAASFGAYMAVFNASLATDKDGIKVAISLKAVLEMSFTAKVALFVLSLICFVFCLSWLLIHKGSKFWQESWETHIYHLEKEYMGEIYWSFLDTKNTEKFDDNFLAIKPYNYSVTRISTLCSLLLAACSFCLAVFHALVLIFSPILMENFCKAAEFRIYLKTVLKAFFLIVIAVLSAKFLRIFYKNSKGNTDGDRSVTYDKNHDYFFNKHDQKTSAIRK